MSYQQQQREFDRKVMEAKLNCTFQEMGYTKPQSSYMASERVS